jgi:3-phenylpropionate/trans-cinnamate dioxygenase ferredoxin component
MEFTTIAVTDEIPEGTMKAFSIKDKEILIINSRHEFHAVDRRCSHMGGDLTKGKLDNGVITCPRHGSKFDIVTGKSLQGPSIGFVKLKTGDINVYPVKTENGKIMVSV